MLNPTLKCALDSADPDSEKSRWFWLRRQRGASVRRLAQATR